MPIENVQDITAELSQLVKELNNVRARASCVGLAVDCEVNELPATAHLPWCLQISLGQIAFYGSPAYDSLMHRRRER